MTFSGFPPSALRLYEDLAADNDKEAWRLRHRERYERDVRAPMDELAAELSTYFKESAYRESIGSGEVTVLGPVRDTRMSHDKSPYKTYQGAYLDLLPCLGLWVHLDRHGLYASGRWYPYAGAEVARYRAAVEEEDGGAELAAIAGRLEAQGFTLGGDRLKSRPRGVPADHPRLGLLRHRKIDAGRRFGPDAGLHTARAGELVRETWRLVRPLLDWVAARELTPQPRERGVDVPS
ncbi:DUF2461 domain-containing protein [Streptomyces virginiae]|uniref:DUF2461 domain-containing protein n=1 Tax=Streptomyces virginiae TaxID=1961 RepID=UPI00224E501A|nr:DUF2461 domain-containing protein [Streptomyces virginiae]MCX4961174.1 DUF2461 domain-containing protein [Streptomyces virginiae]